MKRFLSVLTRRKLLLVSAVVAVCFVIAISVAAIYGLRSTENPPPDIESANQARLESGQPVSLLAGRVPTDILGRKASFKVLDHWYGQQRKPSDALFLGKRLSSGGYEVSVGRGGIEVDTLNLPLARSVRRLESAPGIRVHNVSTVRLGGLSGRRYSFSLKRNHYVMFPNGIGFGWPEDDVILLGMGGQTILIRKNEMAPSDQARREAERVIQSFQFDS